MSAQSIKPAQPFYFVSFFSAGVKAKFSINHFVVANEETGYEFTTTHVVNRWLGQFNNNFKLEVEPAAFPLVQSEEDPQIPTEQAIRVKIFEGTQTEDGMQVDEVLWEYSWPSDDPEQPKELIINKKVIEEVSKANLTRLPLTRLWQYAETIEKLSQQDQYDIVSVVKNLRLQFTQQNYPNAMQFLRYRYEDEEIAEYMQTDSIKQGVLEMWQHYLPSMSLEQVSAEEMKLSLLDNNRAVEVSVLDQEFPIIFSDPEEDILMGIPLYFCKVNEHWIVMR